MIPHSIAMVRPVAFGYNPETAVNNAFQHQLDQFNARQIQDIALLEFNHMVEVLRSKGIDVLVFDDIAADNTPDSIFPNNWFSTFTHELILYGMFTENRQRERKPEIIQALSDYIGKPVNKELLTLEADGKFLEGTGSLVCDHQNKVAYAALSQRTDPEALDRFEALSGYTTLRFESLGPDNELIYHTNVMMTIGDQYAVIGADTIRQEDRTRVISALEAAGKTLIFLDNEQVYRHFAGNMLQLQNKLGQKFLVMSAEARSCLTAAQLEQIKALDNEILSPAIHVIESIGGGSVRCMMAELFLP